MQSTLQKTSRRTRQRHSTHLRLDADPLLELYELLQGEREVVRVHSKALQSDICFVNPGLKNPEELQMDCPVYTTRELAFVLSLSDEEFRRFHYLKTRLVG